MDYLLLRALRSEDSAVPEYRLPCSTAVGIAAELQGRRRCPPVNEIRRIFDPVKENSNPGVLDEREDMARYRRLF